MALFGDAPEYTALRGVRSVRSFIPPGPPQEPVRRHSHTGTTHSAGANPSRQHPASLKATKGPALVADLPFQKGALASPPDSTTLKTIPLTYSVCGIKDILKDLVRSNSFHDRREFPVDSPDALKELVELVEGDPVLQLWSVEYFGGMIVTMPRPGHELLDSFWRKVSRAMETTGWLTEEDIDHLHIHQANIEMDDGSNLRPDLCILPDRQDHYPTIVFETALSQTYKNAVEKVRLWFTGSLGRICFVVIINFKYPKKVLLNKACTIELWKHTGRENGFAPEIVCGPKSIYPEPEHTTSEDLEEVALQFTYEEFFGSDSIPEIYLPIKDTPFRWSMQSLRFAVDLALRSHLKAETFRDKKRKRVEDGASNIADGRGYHEIRDDLSTQTTGDNRNSASTSISGGFISPPGNEF